MKRIIILLTIYLCVVNLMAQSFIIPNYDCLQNDKFEKLNNYQKDFLIYLNLLEKTHPSFINKKLISYTQRDSIVEELSKCNHPKKLEIILNKINSRLKDSHTLTLPISSEKEIYPIKLYKKNNKYHIVLINKKFEKNLGLCIEKINGISITEIENRLSKYLSYENNIKLGLLIPKVLFNPFLLKEINVLDSNSNNNSLQIKLSNKEVIRLNTKNKNIITWSKHYIKEEHPITYKSKALFNYKIQESDNVCYLQINNFLDKSVFELYLKIISEEQKNKIPVERYLKSLPIFSKFLERMFNEMKHENINNLVVDLRNCPGGNSYIGDILLNYISIKKDIKRNKTYIRFSDFYSKHYPVYSRELTNKYKAKKDTLYNISNFSKQFINKYIPLCNVKNKFKGKVVFIQGQQSYSSASYLLTLIKDNKLFPIIGTEISQKPTSYGDVLGYQLPFTNLRGYVSSAFFERPNKGKNAELTLYPDIKQESSINDLEHGIDREWEASINFLNNSNRKLYLYALLMVISILIIFIYKYLKKIKR